MFKTAGTKKGLWALRLLALVAVNVVIASATLNGNTQISKETVSEWLKKIKEESNRAETSLGVTKIEETFNGVGCDVELIDGDSIVDNLKEVIDDVIDKCVTTANNLAEAFSKTELPDKINESTFSYYDSCSEWMPPGETLQYSLPVTDLEMISTERGGTMEVNLSHSSVILLGPTSSQRVSIQKDIQRTAELDEVFIENETFLQYVGTPRGVYRTYPAHTYEENRCYPSENAYDCRSRPWFISSAMGPKDIIILLDGSDSMNINGRLDNAKDAITKFINALSDGDYFNLLWFSEEVGKTSFSETLVRASTVNKNIFLREIDNIETGGGTDLSAAFQEALDMMEKSIGMGLTSSCEHIIILITDGESTDPSDVINEHPLKGDVNIFTYVLGDLVDVSIIENIAQENNGIFSRIRDGGRLDVPLLSYYKFYGHGHESWTEPYYGVSCNSLVITRTLPVYEKDSNELAGVVGVDLRLNGIEDVLNKVKYTSHGYAFLTDNEGQTFYYPGIDMSTATGFYDISLFETVSDDTSDLFNEKIRRRLISHVSGSETATKYTDKLPTIIQKQDINYYFRPIKNSHFSVTLAIPTDQLYSLKFESPSEWEDYALVYGNLSLYNNPKLREFMSDEVYNDITTTGYSYSAISFVVTDFGFCDNKQPEDEIEVISSFHSTINSTETLECGTPGTIFKPEFLQPIGRLITHFHSFWDETLNNDDSAFIRTCITTRNGLNTVYPATTLPAGFDGTERPWYIRASSFPGTTFFSPPYEDIISGDTVVTISRTIELSNGRMIGVVASDIKYEKMNDMLDNATDFRCNKEDNVECFLLDKHGYIFCDSNRKMYPENTFFGSIRGPIAKDLIETGALKYKAVLTPYGSCSNSGSSGDDDGGNGECINIEYYYEFDEDVVGNEASDGRTIVNNCMQGEYHVGAIEGTNLFFVVFQGPISECTPDQRLEPKLKPISDYWSTVGSTPVERYGKSCTEIMDHECLLTCPGNNDPIEEKTVVICGGNGDCLNGECICDPEYEVDDTLDCSLLSGAGKNGPMMVTIVLMMMGLLVLNLILF